MSKAQPDSLRERRLNRGWTLEDLAGKTGLTEAHLSNIETGKTPPGPRASKALARVYGIEIAEVRALAARAAA